MTSVQSVARVIFSILLSIFVLQASSALEVDGVWSGKLDLMLPDGQPVASRAYVSLKLDGTNLTGSCGPSERKQTSIRHAKLEGNRVTFEAGPDTDTLSFNLVLLDGHLKGHAEGQNGTTARVDLTKVASVE
jgi:hypothetical protein